MAQDLTRAMEHAVEGGLRGAHVSATGLEIDEDVDFDRWQEIGSLLGSIDGSVAWWIGDWVNFGERKYGEKYAQAMDATGLDYGRLRVIASVCRNVDLLLRSNNLSFSHHQLVAPLPAEDQERWLTLAADEGLSVRGLKERLAGDGQLPAPAEQPQWTATTVEEIKREAEQEIARRDEEAARLQVEREAWKDAAERAMIASGEMVRCPRCGTAQYAADTRVTVIDA